MRDNILEFQNSACYDIVTKRYDRGVFDESIDCTYIILCCGVNPIRESQVFQQLSKFKPTKEVKLIYNKGFRKCEKKLESQSTQYDLKDALMYIFNDAIEYDKILVLEDDFEVDERILDHNHSNSINSFLVDNDPDVYGLGNMCIINPLYIFKKHQNTMVMIMGQAIVYNRIYRNKILSIYNENKSKLPSHVDVIWNMGNDVVYRYYLPVIYQKFVVTENMHNWPIPIYITKLFVNLLNLEENGRIGLDNLNKLNYMITIILSVLFVIFTNIVLECTFNR